ncbi:MAG: hypothetical protein ABSF91_07555 [Bacteroidota bacterium]|jgi:hypothetical protein
MDVSKDHDETLSLQALEITFDGPRLDAYALAELNYCMHFIVNSVAYSRKYYYPAQPRLRRRLWNPYFESYDFDFVRLEVKQVKSGSLFEIVQLGFASVLSDEWGRAILHHLAADVIMAIIKSGVRIATSSHNQDVSKDNIYPGVIVPLIARLIEVLARCTKGRHCKLRISHTNASGERFDVELDIE